MLTSLSWKEVIEAGVTLDSLRTAVHVFGGHPDDMFRIFQPFVKSDLVWYIMVSQCLGCHLKVQVTARAHVRKKCVCYMTDPRAPFAAQCSWRWYIALNQTVLWKGSIATVKVTMKVKLFMFCVHTSRGGTSLEVRVSCEALDCCVQGQAKVI